jgi:hypothetical protein
MGQGVSGLSKLITIRDYLRMFPGTILAWNNPRYMEQVVVPKHRFNLTIVLNNGKASFTDASIWKFFEVNEPTTADSG